MAREAEFTEQIVALLTKEQREWLETVAEQRKCWLAEVVREAIDEKMRREGALGSVEVA